MRLAGMLWCLYCLEVDCADCSASSSSRSSCSCVRCGGVEVRRPGGGVGGCLLVACPEAELR